MVIVYGADWCEDTQRSLRHLRRLGIARRYLNVDADPEALEQAKRLTDGKRRTPVIAIASGNREIPEILVEPKNASLTDAVVRHELISRAQASERLRVQNVGDLERALRVGAGLVGLLMARNAPRGLRLPLAAVALSTSVSGVTGWCPTYGLLGLTSMGGPLDRPKEAERTEWWANAIW